MFLFSIRHHTWSLVNLQLSILYIAICQLQIFLLQYTAYVPYKYIAIHNIAVLITMQAYTVYTEARKVNPSEYQLIQGNCTRA